MFYHKRGYYIVDENKQNKHVFDAVEYQEARLLFGGVYTRMESVKRIDERETTLTMLFRNIWVGRDDTEALALVISPICMCSLLNRYCNRGTKKKSKKAQGAADRANADGGKTQEDKSDTKDDDSDSDDNNGTSCICIRVCRRIDMKSEEIVTRERLVKELERDLLEENLVSNSLQPHIYEEAYHV